MICEKVKNIVIFIENKYMIMSKCNLQILLSGI